MATKKPKRELRPLKIEPHPLAGELCLLKEKIMRAGLHATGQKLERAIRAIGWELVARAPEPPMPSYYKTPQDVRWYKRATASMRKNAWKELEKA